MRRGITAVLILLALGASSASTGVAGAAPPPFANLAPADGAQLPLGTFVFETLRFTCPSYSEGTTSHDYHDYSYRLTDSPEVEAPGKLAIFNTFAEGSAIPLAAGECTGYAGPPKALPAGLYYWQVFRGGFLIGEVGPIWSFRVGSTKATVKALCLTESRFAQRPVCPAGSKLAGSFMSPIETAFVLCYKAPGKARRCLPKKKAMPEESYIRQIPFSGPGTYALTWKADRRTYTKHVQVKG